MQLVRTDARAGGNKSPFKPPGEHDVVNYEKDYANDYVEHRRSHFNRSTSNAAA